MDLCYFISFIMFYNKLQISHPMFPFQSILWTLLCLFFSSTYSFDEFDELVNQTLAIPGPSSSSSLSFTQPLQNPPEDHPFDQLLRELWTDDDEPEEIRAVQPSQLANSAGGARSCPILIEGNKRPEFSSPNIVGQKLSENFGIIVPDEFKSKTPKGPTIRHKNSQISIGKTIPTPNLIVLDNEEGNRDQAHQEIGDASEYDQWINDEYPIPQTDQEKQNVVTEFIQRTIELQAQCPQTPNDEIANHVAKELGYSCATIYHWNMHLNAKRGKNPKSPIDLEEGGLLQDATNRAWSPSLSPNLASNSDRNMDQNVTANSFPKLDLILNQSLYMTDQNLNASSSLNFASSSTTNNLNENRNPASSSIHNLGSSGMPSLHFKLNQMATNAKNLGENQTPVLSLSSQQNVSPSANTIPCSSSNQNLATATNQQNLATISYQQNVAIKSNQNASSTSNSIFFETDPEQTDKLFPDERKREILKDYGRMCHTLRIRDPNRSMTDISNEVSKKLNYPIRTLYRWNKNLKSNNARPNPTSNLGTSSTPNVGGSSSTPNLGGPSSTPNIGGSSIGGSSSTPNLGGPSSTPNLGGPSSTPNIGGSSIGGSSSTPNLGGPSSTPNVGGPSSTLNLGGPSSTPNLGGPSSTLNLGGSSSTPNIGGSSSTLNLRVPLPAPGASSSASPRIGSQTPTSTNVESSSSPSGTPQGRKRRKTHYTNAEKMAKIQEYFALAENPDLSEDERLKILNISKPTLNKWTLEWRLEELRQNVSSPSSRSAVAVGSTSTAADGSAPPPNSSSSSAAAAGDNPNGEDGRCVVCLTNKPEVAFTPCGHFITCKSCADIIMKTGRKCPFCRLKIKGQLKIFTVN